MFRKITKKYNSLLRKFFFLSKIEGDSFNYELLDSAVKRLNHPIGTSFEIGVRRGLGSKIIIDAYRKYHPQIKNLVHIGLDPYGDLPYNFSETEQNIMNFGYTDLMKRELLINFSKRYSEFYFVNLDTHEFFGRFADGYPVYQNKKKIINKFEIVHFDGLHDLKNITLEVNYFLGKLSDHTIFIFDDVDTFDMKPIDNILYKNGFEDFESSGRKKSFEYKVK